VKDNLLLFNDAMMQSEEKPIAACADVDGMSATGEVCRFLCEMFKHSTTDVASDFVHRWIHKSHLEMNTLQLQLRQHLQAMEQERVQQLQMAESSKHQVQLGIEMLSDEREKAATEIEKLKESASVDIECMTSLFMMTFEKYCNNQDCLQSQQKLMAKERLQREFQHRLAKEKDDHLMAFAAKAKKELSFCRSTIVEMANVMKVCRKEYETQFKNSEMSIFGLIEDRQRENHAHIEETSSHFRKSLDEKDNELGTLNRSIEEKDACVMILSEKLILKETQLIKARHKNDQDDLLLAEMKESLSVAQNQIQELRMKVANMANEKSALLRSLNQECDTSAKLKREAIVMEENFRRIDKDNDQLRILNETQDRNASSLQLALNKELEVRSQIEMDCEKHKVESETYQLSRDKLRYYVIVIDVKICY
jgi:hypothetical protein